MSRVEIIPQIVQRKKQLRTAAYARVSIEKEMSIVSLSAQIDYYTKYINKNPDWTLAGIYIDEAKTGTNDTRDNFTRLMEDCRAGKIDHIITKTVSRFARNTVLLLSSCRELKELGIDVYFEAQHIHSISEEGELMLSLMASLAQEEARSDSENMLWAVKKRFEAGMPWSGKIYGYRLKNGVFEIVPQEAEIVRRIFQYYLDGLGIRRISNILNSEGVPTRHDTSWHETTIRVIISNITYTGTLILQKTYRENYITKKKLMNHGERDMFIVEEAHEPIIDKETFDSVQSILKEKAERKEGTKKARYDYPFSKKIVCENCGSHFQRRTLRNKIAWICYTYNRYGKSTCFYGKQIPDDELIRTSAEVLGLDIFDEHVFSTKIDHITACSGNRLVFHFFNGTTAERTWRERSRAESWTPEMKEKARQARLRRRDLCQR